jgi:hypothetical protein
MREGVTPAEASVSATAVARRSDSAWLWVSEPTLSVCPMIST